MFTSIFIHLYQYFQLEYKNLVTNVIHLILYCCIIAMYNLYNIIIM